MMSYRLRLVGNTPLLIHADDIDGRDILEEWRKDPGNKKASKAGDDRSPPWTWHTYLYHDGERLTVPSDNLMVCIRTAATQFTLKKQKTFKELSQSGMYIADEHMPLSIDGQEIPLAEIAAMRDMPFKQQREAVKELGFELLVKSVRVGMAKHVRVRAKLPTWELTTTMTVIAPEITEELLERMMQIAGRVGICDWRPGGRTPGRYGMFEAEIRRNGK